jgi:hypothetical protein
MPRNSSATPVEIERTNLTERGQRYRVVYAGETLSKGAEIRSSMHAEGYSLGGSPAGSRCGAGARQAPICNSISRRALA